MAILAKWGEFNVLEDLTVAADNPLTAIAMTIFIENDLFAQLNLDVDTCIRFFLTIEKNYARYPDLAYHTNLHAVDVVNSLYVLLQNKTIKPHLSPLDLFSSVVAAAVHDVGHTGVTNQYLCSIDDPMALLYKKQSVLENYHAMTTFLIVAKYPQCDIFKALTPAQRTQAHQLIIQIVLGTDMSCHAQHLNEVAALTNSMTKPINLAKASQTDMNKLLCALVHFADVGASAKPWKQCHEWAQRIMTELFALGDKEKALGLPVGYDRTKVTLAQSQVLFIDNVITPIWTTWDNFIELNTSSNDGSSLQSINVAANRQQWLKKAI